MNFAMRTRAALALAACLAAAATANASLQDDGRTYQPAGDDHARSAVSVSTPVTIASVGDDHARTAQLAIPTPVTTASVGDDHARTSAARVGPPLAKLDGTSVASVSVPSPTTTPIVPSADGFDWNDAGVGFGAAMGFALLAGASAFAARKVRAPHTPAI